MLFHAQAFVYFWVEWWFYKVIATWNVLIKWPEVVQDQYYHFQIGDRSHLIQMARTFCQTDISGNHLQESHLWLT